MLPTPTALQSNVKRLLILLKKIQHTCFVLLTLGITMLPSEFRFSALPTADGLLSFFGGGIAESNITWGCEGRVTVSVANISSS